MLHKEVIVNAVIVIAVIVIAVIATEKQNEDVILVLPERQLGSKLNIKY